MDELLKTLNGYLQAAAKLVAEQAPMVWDATKHLIRLQEGIVLGSFILVYTITLILLFHARGKLIQGATKDKLYCRECVRTSPMPEYIKWDMDCWWGGQFILSIVILVITSGVFLGNVMQIFLGLYDPALLIMYRLAQAAGIM